MIFGVFRQVSSLFFPDTQNALPLFLRRTLFSNTDLAQALKNLDGDDEVQVIIIMGLSQTIWSAVLLERGSNGGRLMRFRDGMHYM